MRVAGIPIWLLKLVALFKENPIPAQDSTSYDIIDIRFEREDYTQHPPFILQIDDNYLYTDDSMQTGPFGSAEDVIELARFDLSMLYDKAYLIVVLYKKSYNKYKIGVALSNPGFFDVDNSSKHVFYVKLLSSNSTYILDDFTIEHIKSLLPKETEQFKSNDIVTITKVDKLKAAMTNTLQGITDYKESKAVTGSSEVKQFLQSFVDKLSNSLSAFFYAFDPVLLNNIRHKLGSYKGRKIDTYIHKFRVIRSLYWSVNVLNTLQSATYWAYVIPFRDVSKTKTVTPVLSKALAAHIFSLKRKQLLTTSADIYHDLFVLFDYISNVFFHISTYKIPRLAQEILNNNTDLTSIDTWVDYDSEMLVPTSPAKAEYTDFVRDVIRMFFQQSFAYHYKLTGKFIKDLVSKMTNKYKHGALPPKEKEILKTTLEFIYGLPNEKISTIRAFIIAMSLALAYKLYFRQFYNANHNIYDHFIAAFTETEQIMERLLPHPLNMDADISEYFNHPVYQFTQYDLVFDYKDNKRLKPKYIPIRKEEALGLSFHSDVYSDIQHMIEKVVKTV